MFFKLAWRNLWRNKRRTWITLAVMALSCTFMLLMVCGAIGYHQEAINNSVKAGTGHIQIHRDGFFTMFTPRYFMEADPELIQLLDSEPQIQSYARRIKGPGLITYSTKAKNVTIIGIDPEREPKVSVFHKKPAEKGPLIDGKYLSSDDWQEGYPDGDTSKNFHLQGVLVGYKIAKNFKMLDAKGNLKPNREVVLTLQSCSGEVHRNLFAVRGVFRTLMPEYDEGTVLIHYLSAQKLYGYAEKKRLSEIAIITKKGEYRHDLAAKLRKQLAGKGYEILTWDEMSRSIVEFLAMDNFFVFLFVGILFVVMAIGLLITLLASIFERMHEFGILRAIGLSPFRLAMLIMTESFWLSVLGCISGGIVSTPLLYLYIVYGIDMGAFMEEGISLWAITLDTRLYAVVEPGPVALCLGFLVVFSLVVTLYPAIKASRINIIEAITFT